VPEQGRRGAVPADGAELCVRERVRSGNGPEFIAKAVRDWIGAGSARTAGIAPGRSWETLMPSADTAAMLFWALLASGQVIMRKVHGWQTLAAVPADPVIDLAA
jgi:hypothetical protein